MADGRRWLRCRVYPLTGKIAPARCLAERSRAARHVPKRRMEHRETGSRRPPTSSVLEHRPLSGALLHELFEGPRRNIARVGWGTRPRVGSHRESAPGIEGCTHLGWIECEHVIADIYAVRNPDHLEGVA